MTRIAFLTLGCKLNYAETSTYERGFRAEGLEVVPWNEKADIYLVNTCSVTATSDSKSRNLIRKVHRVNPDARIIVTGCSAELRRRELEGIEGVSRVFGCNEKALVVAETLYGPAKAAQAGMPDMFGAYSSGERTRSFLKVQDGCDNFCKYCTVPYARGPQAVFGMMVPESPQNVNDQFRKVPLFWERPGRSQHHARLAVCPGL